MRIVLCDDNRLLGEALASVFETRGHPVVAITTSVADGIAAVATHRPDACLLDLHFPAGSGLDAARTIRRCYPDTKVVVLSCLDDPAVVSEAKNIGVAGFLRKDLRADTIAIALDRISAGKTAFDQSHPGPMSGRPPSVAGNDLFGLLTPRESQVLRRIVAGQGTRQMAREMNLATSTLRGYIKNILAKLGAHSRLQAAAIASRDPAFVGQPALRNLLMEPREDLARRTAPGIPDQRRATSPGAPLGIGRQVVLPPPR